MGLMTCNRGVQANLLEKPSALQLEIAANNGEPLFLTHLPTTGIYG